MSEWQEGFKIIIMIISIVQVFLGCGAWYIGLQIKLLRLELMPRELCNERHDRIMNEVAKLSENLAVVQSKINQSRL